MARAGEWVDYHFALLKAGSLMGYLGYIVIYRDKSGEITEGIVVRIYDDLLFAMRVLNLEHHDYVHLQRSEELQVWDHLPTRWQSGDTVAWHWARQWREKHVENSK